MFKKKYVPSIKANNQLRDKVVNEVKAFVYRLEHGKYESGADQEVINRVIEDLRNDIDTLGNTVGTGEENLEALSNNILSLLKDLKKSSEQDMVHRIQEVADDLDFNVNLWKDVLDGTTVMPTEEETKAAKLSYTRRKLNARLSELSEIRESFTSNARRIEKEITGFEKDLAEMDAAILNEDNERKINELYKKISAAKSKVDSLAVRKSNYSTCFNLLDMIYVNAAEIVQASDLAGEEIGKAKALLNMGKLKKVMSEPDKAMVVLKRMKKDIDEIYEKTRLMDEKIAEITTESTVVGGDAMAYKEELMRKKREKEMHEVSARELDAMTPAAASEPNKNTEENY